LDSLKGEKRILQMEESMRKDWSEKEQNSFNATGDQAVCQSGWVRKE
jgi:hypothetical protein